MSNCALSPQQYKDYIVTAMSLSDPCAPSDLNQTVALFWDLSKLQSMCDPELQYLLTTRETIKYLMGCKVWEVDYSQSRSQNDMGFRSTQRQDGWNQAQSTGQSTSFRDAIGQSRYNDFSDASMDAVSQRNAQAQSHDESEACMHDIGHGGSMSETQGERKSRNQSVSGSQNQAIRRTDGKGSRGSCNYRFSASKARGDSYGALLWMGGATGKRSSWTQYQRDYTENEEKVRNSAFRESQANSAGGSNSKTERQSSSYFNSHIDDGSSSQTTAHSEDHATGSRDSKSHAEGLGQSSNESKGQGQHSMQGTSQAHSDGEQHRERNSSGYSVMDSAKLHQRFQHLRNMYDQLTERIEHEKAHLRAGMKIYGGLFKHTSCLPGLPEPCFCSSCGSFGACGCGCGNDQLRHNNYMGGNRVSYSH